MIPNWYKYFNYGSIALIVILLIVVLTVQLEQNQYVMMLYAAIALLVFRVLFRVYFLVKSKKAKEE